MSNCQQASSFTVKFGGTVRVLTRRQLERAPDSLVSAALLESNLSAGGNRLIIPARGAGATDGIGVWENGTAEAFQVCMDCYLEDSDFKLERSFSQIVPAKQLLIPALEFFNIPAALWPPGARMVKHIIDHPRDYQQALRRQMQACVQHLEAKVNAKLGAASHVPQPLEDYKATFIFSVGTSNTPQPEGTLYWLSTDMDHLGMGQQRNYSNCKLLTEDEKLVLSQAGKALQVKVKFELAGPLEGRQSVWSTMTLSCPCSEASTPTEACIIS